MEQVIINYLELNTVITKLIDLKQEIIDSYDFQNRVSQVNEAKIRFKEILDNNNFEQEGFLDQHQLNEVFSLMRRFSSNQSLTKLIYEDNNIHNFNTKLKNLYFGDDPFPKRIDDFLQLNKVGEQTLSQFLVIFDDDSYPLSTFQMKELLNFDSNQVEKAKKIAIENYNLDSFSSLSSTTIQYLTYTVIYEIVKNILDLDNYYHINLFLWLYRKYYREDEEEEEGPFTSIHLEDDLRDYLAEHLNLIENDLVLIEKGKEYDAKLAGRIDLLCKDIQGDYVVVELKRRGTGDQVVGQILRYIGWVKANLGENVRGIIIINEPYKSLDFAIKPIKDFVQVKYYRVKFEIKNEYQEN